MPTRDAIPESRGASLIGEGIRAAAPSGQFAPFYQLRFKSREGVVTPVSVSGCRVR